MFASWTVLAALVAQPTLDLPIEHDSTEAPTAPRIAATEPLPDTALVRGLQDLRLRLPGTVVGSYGQFNLEYVQRNGRGPITGTANLRRLVVFVSHHFTDTVRAYTEIEWENAVACSTCAGAVEIEQGFVDWDLPIGVTLRTGLILVPMGIVNQWHEPPVFHGVNRPAVDTWNIPTTWRELGIGAVGRFGQIWRYELYAMTSPDALHLGPLGLRHASAAGSEVPANSFMFAGRLEAEPLLGFVLGAAGVAGNMGDADRFFTAGHRVSALAMPLWGAALDGRWRRHGLEARVEGAAFWLPQAGALLNALAADGSLYFPSASTSGAIPTFLYGAYAEVAYDVLRLAGESGHQLLPFVRFEIYDTQAQVPGGFRRLFGRQGVETTLGLSYRPIQQLVFKGDVQWAWHRALAREIRLNAGMGYMF